MPAYVPIDDEYTQLWEEEEIRNRIALLDRRGEWIKDTLVKDLQAVATSAKRRGLITIAQELDELIETNLLRVAKMENIKARYRMDIDALKTRQYTYAGAATAMRAQKRVKITRLKPNTMITRAVGRIGGRVPKF